MARKPAKVSPSKSALDQMLSGAEQLREMAPTLTKKEATEASRDVQKVVGDLRRLVSSLDPIREPSSIFDPADPNLVGKFVGIALVAQDRVPLSDLHSFYGAGVYALYYKGPLAAYAPLAGTETPIYVGKADPATPSATTPRQQETRLARRLFDHFNSIRKAQEHAEATLDLAHFECRFLVVQSGWQTAAENYLINLFRPVWNDEIRLCYGLGKHGDDPDTRGNLRPPWDTMHPGRAWAYKLKKDGTQVADAKPRAQILSELALHFTANQPFQTVDAILRRFFADLHQGG